MVIIIPFKQRRRLFLRGRRSRASLNQSTGVKKVKAINKEGGKKNKWKGEEVERQRQKKMIRPPQPPLPCPQ